jgi:hypothetical protein
MYPHLVNDSICRSCMQNYLTNLVTVHKLLSRVGKGRQVKRTRIPHIKDNWCMGKRKAPRTCTVHEGWFEITPHKYYYS